MQDLDINQLRKEIDALDEQLIELIAKRFVIVKDVAKYKEQHKINVYDAAREHYLHDLYQQLSSKYKVSFAFIKQVLGIIIEESKKIQHKENDGR